MNFFIDVHDWLGGYPYESISPLELRSKMKIFGFQEYRSFTHQPELVFLVQVAMNLYLRNQINVRVAK